MKIKELDLWLLIRGRSFLIIEVLFMLCLLRQESFSVGEEAPDFPLGVLKGIFYFTGGKGGPCVLRFRRPSSSSPHTPFRPSLTCAPESRLDLFSPAISHRSLLTAPPSFRQWGGGAQGGSRKPNSQPGKLRRTRAKGLRKPCRSSIAKGSGIRSGFPKGPR